MKSEKRINVIVDDEEVFDLFKKVCSARGDSMRGVVNKFVRDYVNDESNKDYVKFFREIEKKDK